MRKLAAMLMGLTAALWAEGAAADAKDLEIFHSIAINAPADEVWAMAGDFGKNISNSFLRRVVET